jgi:AcrR family transcriptional regulator
VVSLAEQARKPERYEEILAAAAECFSQQGFAATSIDAVARHLGSTKGRVYHYFPSKMDLFNAVRDRGMELSFEAIRPGYRAQASAVDRLALMAHGQCYAMMKHITYMQVLLDGLRQRRYGATTEFQRSAMKRHLEQRDQFEARYIEVLQAAADDGALRIGDMHVVSRSFLAGVNAPVFWFVPRADDCPEKLGRFADEITQFAMQGLGVAWTPERMQQMHKLRDLENA